VISSGLGRLRARRGRRGRSAIARYVQILSLSWVILSHSDGFEYRLTTSTKAGLLEICVSFVARPMSFEKRVSTTPASWCQVIRAPSWARTTGGALATASNTLLQYASDMRSPASVSDSHAASATSGELTI